MMDAEKKKWLDKYGILLVLLLACVIAMILILTPAKQQGGDYGDFLNALGMRESSNDYTVVNRYNYMGRYQLGEDALKDAGFIDKNGAWTELANSYGIYSQEDFLNAPDGQDAAVTAYHTALCRYIRGYGLADYIGSTYCDVEVTQSGLLAACHLVGVGSMKKALASGEVVRDGNKVPASEYLKLFAGYDIAAVWKEQE